MKGFIGVLLNQPVEQQRNMHSLNENFFEMENGQQSLKWNDERYWMTFNGRIYNATALRNHLIEQGFVFKTESEAELLLTLFKNYGVDTFSKLRGMFAVLIWDTHQEPLVGARDSFGIKPLFYSEQTEGIYFATEKKSILERIQSKQMDPASLQHYFSFQYVPEPMTMTSGVKKVEPGCYFEANLSDGLKFTRFSKLTFQPNPTKSEEDWKMEIKDALSDSVRVHMQSDLPVGAFLSGGIDSTIIVALAKEHNPNLKTFSVGFEREGFSEIDVAQETAEKLGVDNYRLTVSPEEYMNRLPRLIWHLEDPLADPACVPLYFVAREAAKHVSVVLSGEGSDELFGGYNIYHEPESLKMFDSMPQALKGILNRVATVIPEGVKGKSFLERGTTSLNERYIGNAKMFEEAEKATFLKTYDPQITYHDMTRKIYADTAHLDPVHQMQSIDIHTWMRGDILLKAERMTSAHELELRVPFLDREVMKVASQIPAEFNIAHGTTKWLLRESVKSIIPAHVLTRKKLGFPVPIRHWLKNEMYDWARELMLESETEAYLDKAYLLTLLERHRVGKIDYSRKIWTVLMFMSWHQVFVEKKYDFQSAFKPGGVEQVSAV